MKKAHVQKQGEFAAAMEVLQFRDLRAKAGTDKEEWVGMTAAKD
ncbi:hypothetical protein [Paraburkholderia bonniea]|nr:hypothetical protein [Paraburkholderia bonniea]